MDQPPGGSGGDGGSGGGPGPGQEPPRDPDDPREILRQFMQDEVMPLVDIRMREVTDAKVSALKSGLNIPDTALLVQQVIQELGPRVAADVNKIFEPVEQRLTSLEGRPAPVAAAQPGETPIAVTGPVAQPAQSTTADMTINIMKQADTLLDLFVDKLLPAYETWKRARSATSNDLNWAERIRNEDPVKATVLAQRLNPDPLNQQLPYLMTNAYITGMKVRQTAQGGGQWPLTPSPGLPNSTPGSSDVPQGPGGPQPGVSMSSKQRSNGPRGPKGPAAPTNGTPSSVGGRQGLKRGLKRLVDLLG